MITMVQYNQETNTNYHGFTIQPGFWCGYDSETKEYLASSGWEVGNNLALYRCTEHGWEMEWLDQEEVEIAAGGFTAPDLESKKSFNQWLREDYGVEPEYYDNNYSNTEQVEEEYRNYYYDGLPLFACSKENLERAQKEAAENVRENTPTQDREADLAQDNEELDRDDEELEL